MTNQEAIQKLKEALAEGKDEDGLLIKESHRRLIMHVEYMDKIMRDRDNRLNKLEQAIIEHFIRENSND